MVRYIEVMFRGLGLDANLQYHVQASHYSMFRYIVVMSRGLGPGINIQGHVQLSHYIMFRYREVMFTFLIYIMSSIIVVMSRGLEHVIIGNKGLCPVAMDI